MSDTHGDNAARDSGTSLVGQLFWAALFIGIVWIAWKLIVWSYKVLCWIFWAIGWTIMAAACALEWEQLRLRGYRVMKRGTLITITRKNGGDGGWSAVPVEGRHYAWYLLRYGKPWKDGLPLVYREVLASIGDWA